MGSVRSSSISDLNNLFERNARKEIQKKLFAAFDLTYCYVNKQEKKLDDSTVFSMITKFIPSARATSDGEIDVYFGLTSPPQWQVKDEKYLQVNILTSYSSLGFICGIWLFH